MLDSVYLSAVVLHTLWWSFCCVNHTFPHLVWSNNLHDMQPELAASFPVLPTHTHTHNTKVSIASSCFVRKRTDLGSASCAYWADNQSYRTTGSVQQEQESSPLLSEQETNTSAGPNTLYWAAEFSFQELTNDHIHHFTCRVISFI